MRYSRCSVIQASATRVIRIAFAASVSVGVATAQPLTAPDYLHDAEAARRDVVRYGAFRVESISLGGTGTGTNRFRAIVTNVSDAPAELGLEVRALAGQWSSQGDRRRVAVSLAAAERRAVEIEYLLGRFTVEAMLRVTLGRPFRDERGSVRVEEPFFVRWYALGSGNPAATDLAMGMVQRATPHLTLYAVANSPAARDLGAIATERERGLDTISALLGTRPRQRIRMVFYPDSATKARATGHIGMGLAFDRNIVEIYTETERLDPFHELTHIIAAGLGNPPAAFDEGLATYVTERLGGDALLHLGNPGKGIRATTCGYLRGGRTFSLDSLLRMSEFGSDAAAAEVAYPQAATFVEFLIDRYGADRLRQAYATLVATDQATQRALNAATVEKIFGTSLQQLERAWLATLACPTGN